MCLSRDQTDRVTSKLTFHADCATSNGRDTAHKHKQNMMYPPSRHTHPTNVHNTSSSSACHQTDQMRVEVNT